MPKFDVVSEVDLVEVQNAVDQAQREIKTRFDFKGVTASFEREDYLVNMTAEADFQLKQMLDILETKLVRRSIDIACLSVADPVASGKTVRQEVMLRNGIEADLARRLVKVVKSQKLKVQAAIQGDKVRVTGKKRDDLQKTIALIKNEPVDLPLQFINFRD